MIAAFFFTIYTFFVEFFTQKKLRNALKEQEKKNEHLERELEERDLEIIRVQMLNDRLHMQTREVEDIDDRRAQIYFETLDKLKRYRKHVDNMAYEISKLRNEKSELQRYIETLKTEIFNLNYERNEEMVQQRHRWAYKNNVLDNQITFSRNFIDHLQTKARFETRQREIDYLQKVDDLYQGRRNLFNYSPHPELEIPSTPSSQSELLTSDFEHLENFQLLLIDTASVASTNNDLKSTDIAPPPGLSLPQPQSSSSVSYFYTPGRQSPPKFDINNLEDFPEL